MKTYGCPTCGYSYTSDQAPERCPFCEMDGNRFTYESESGSIVWPPIHFETVVEGNEAFLNDKLLPLWEDAISGKSWPAEHEVGYAMKGNPVLIERSMAMWNEACREVGVYLAMAHIAMREGYPEIAHSFEDAAKDAENHARLMTEHLGIHVSTSTKENLENRLKALRVSAMNKVSFSKLATLTKMWSMHDTTHEMSRDDARNGKVFESLLKRYF